MARLNVYVPDELAERARRGGLNVSALTQAAISAELARQATDRWLDELVPPRRGASHAAVVAAVDEGRAHFGDDAPDVGGRADGAASVADEGDG
jgi:post-segregation antitoxin (ccd killing protein)